MLNFIISFLCVFVCLTLWPQDLNASRRLFNTADIAFRNLARPYPVGQILSLEPKPSSAIPLGSGVLVDIPGIDKSLCGRVVLTAAHVFPKYSLSVENVNSKIMFLIENQSSHIEVSEGIAISHPDYRPGCKEFRELAVENPDIGILILNSALERTTASPILLDLQKDVGPGRTVINVGCGIAGMLFTNQIVNDCKKRASRSMIFQPHCIGRFVTSLYDRDSSNRIYALEPDQLPGCVNEGDSGGGIFNEKGQLLAISNASFFWDIQERELLFPTQDSTEIGEGISEETFRAKEIKQFEELIKGRNAQEKYRMVQYYKNASLYNPGVPSPIGLSIAVAPYLTWIQSTLNRFVQIEQKKKELSIRLFGVDVPFFR